MDCALLGLCTLSVQLVAVGFEIFVTVLFISFLIKLFR